LVLEKTLLNLYSVIKENILLDDAIKARSKIITQGGIKPFDALHLACAEAAAVDVLLTTDVAFMKKARGLSYIRVDNPVNWLVEVRDNEN
jgi:predicted nucleic acid-binding protein